MEKEREPIGPEEPQIYSLKGLEAETDRDYNNKHDERGYPNSRNKISDRRGPGS